MFWAFKIVAVNPKTHCTLSPTTNKQKNITVAVTTLVFWGKKESSSSRLRVMTQLSLVVCVFPFKYSLAALLENDYLQNALQMIFKFQKEFCTLWSTVKYIYIYSLFIANQSLQFSFILHTSLLIRFCLLPFPLHDIFRLFSFFQFYYRTLFTVSGLFSAELPYISGTDQVSIECPCHSSTHHPPISTSFSP